MLMMHFIFNTQPMPLFPPLSPPLIYISILSLLCSAPLPPPSSLPSAFKSSVSPTFLYLSSRLSLPHCVGFPCTCNRGVFKQNWALPEGTEAGLKGANSSVGGCRPCVESRVLAGDTGVCAGCDGEGQPEEKRIIANMVQVFFFLTHRSQGVFTNCSYSLMER